MRIVGGRHGGRTLAAPKSQAIRPTADRLREALFNILAHSYGDPVEGARVLDLFAGTGALGLGILPPEQRTPAYLAKFLKEDVERWGKVIRAAGISVE